MLFILAMVFVLPCALLLTSCGGQSESDLRISIEPSSNVGSVVLMNIDAESEYGGQYLGSTQNLNYSVWVQDCCDKDTLKVYLDETEIELTEVVDEGEYANKNLSTSLRKIATFKLDPNLKGEHKLSWSVDMEMVTVRFVNNGQFEKYTAREKDLLKNWYFTESDGTRSDNLFELLDAQVNHGAEPYSFDVPYNKMDRAIQYTCSKPLGYYYDYIFWRADMNTPIYCMSYSKETREGDVRYSHYEGAPMEFNATIEKGKTVDIYVNSVVDNGGDIVMDLVKLQLGNIEDPSSNSMDYLIYQIKNGGTTISAGEASWTIENEEAIKVYFKHREGVDFTNLKVYLYEEEMELLSDGNDKYFVIEKGKLPIDYCQELDVLHDFAYMIRVEGVEIAENTFAIISTTTNIDNSRPDITYSSVDTLAYFRDDGTTYCINGEKAKVSYSLSLENEILTGLNFNGEVIDLSDKNAIRDDLPVHNEGAKYTGSDTAWELGMYTEVSRNYFYRITTTSGVDLLIQIGINSIEGDDSYGRVHDVYVTFNINGNANLQLLFNSSN